MQPQRNELLAVPVVLCQINDVTFGTYSGHDAELLAYTVDRALKVVLNRTFRHKVRAVGGASKLMV